MNRHFSFKRGCRGPAVAPSFPLSLKFGQATQAAPRPVWLLPLLHCIAAASGTAQHLHHCITYYILRRMLSLYSLSQPNHVAQSRALADGDLPAMPVEAPFRNRDPHFRPLASLVRGCRPPAAKDTLRHPRGRYDQRVIASDALKLSVSIPSPAINDRRTRCSCAMFSAWL